MSVGVVIGRFQINELHTGHLALLGCVNQTHDKMLILIGVRQAETSDIHPLGFESRRAMLQEAYSDATILPIIDRRDDHIWSLAVDEMIQSVYGHEYEAVFHVGRDSFASHYHGRYEVIEHNFCMVDIASRKARQGLKDGILVTPEARAGAIHAIMNLPHRHTLMVDMFVFLPTEDSYRVLVGAKTGEQGWRLPGGRVESGETFARAASRELREETGINLTDGIKGWRIVGDFDINDWRVDDTERVTYKTVLMIAEHSWGAPTAGDDLADVAWQNVEELNVVEEHRPLIAAAVGFLKGAKIEQANSD